MGRADAVILAIDPSSTRTGYAILADDGRLIEHGLLKPRRAKDEPHARIDTMVAELLAFRDEHAGIDCVVVEDTDGKVARRLGGIGAGMAIYGMAVRAFRDAARQIWGADAVNMVQARVWTAGRHKSSRAAAIGLTAAGDTGLDAADAVGLGLWWIAHREPVGADLRRPSPKR